MNDSLDRFVAAQEGSWPAAREEIAAGAKRGHWMWWIFPQLRGLGRSATARDYGLADREEAARYLDHPVLGPRLVEAADLMLSHRGRAAEDILGPTDAMKLRSCATLFAAVPAAPPVFRAVLDAFYEGSDCPLTTGALG